MFPNVYFRSCLFDFITKCTLELTIFHLHHFQNIKQIYEEQTVRFSWIFVYFQLTLLTFLLGQSQREGISTAAVPSSYVQQADDLHSPYITGVRTFVRLKMSFKAEIKPWGRLFKGWSINLAQ